MRKRRNTSPPLGPDTCAMDACGALAQTSLSASGETLRALGFPETEERVTMRVCLKCYLRAMAEALARARKPLTGSGAMTLYAPAASKVKSPL